jgi:hypothetical protein
MNDFILSGRLNKKYGTERFKDNINVVSIKDDFLVIDIYDGTQPHMTLALDVQQFAHMVTETRVLWNTLMKGHHIGP